MHAKWVRVVVVFFAASAAVTTLGGCPFTDSTISEFDDAIRAIQTESQDWRAATQELEEKLIADGRSVLANEVRTIIDSVPQRAGVEVRCGADFLTVRASGTLVTIRDRLKGVTTPTTPALCMPVPAEINMDLAPQDRPTIIYDGYNITEGSVSASIERAKQLIPVDETLLGFPSPYMVTINTTALDLREGDTRLFLKVGTDQDTATKWNVTIKPKSQKPVYVASTVHITGTVGLHDDETWPMDDENKTDAINKYVVVPLEGSSYHWENCVGDEVQGYLDIVFSLNKDTGAVFGAWTAEYYEGDDCGRTELQLPAKSATMTLPKGESRALQVDGLSDGQGGVTWKLVLQNSAQMTSSDLAKARGKLGR